MGLEAKVVARQGQNVVEGRLFLDSRALSFRSKELKWSVDLGPKVQADVARGQLTVREGRKKIIFEIGEKAQRWADKILNPPSRMTKLGVKAEQKCWLSKGFNKEFRDELKQQGASITRQPDACDLAFCFIADRTRLDQLEEVVNQLSVGTNVWVVWPKGVTGISRSEVMEEARSLGMGPSKTASFDDEHSSMRYAVK